MKNYSLSKYITSNHFLKRSKFYDEKHDKNFDTFGKNFPTILYMK